MILVATMAVFAAFGRHALSGAPFEMRIVGAMTLRTGFRAVMAWVAARTSGERGHA